MCNSKNDGFCYECDCLICGDCRHEFNDEYYCEECYKIEKEKQEYSMARPNNIRIRMICNECDHAYTGFKSSICPKCQSFKTEDLKTARENFNYAEFQGDVDYSELDPGKEEREDREDW